MNIETEIRQLIEKNKEMKLSISEMNNHLNIIEGLVSREDGRRVEEAYQRGYEDCRADIERGCDGCTWWTEGFNGIHCKDCKRSYTDRYERMPEQDDEIRVGDEVIDIQSGARFGVTHFWESNHGNKGVSGFNRECSAFQVTIDKVKKTGRHFDIEKILEAMRC